VYFEPLEFPPARFEDLKLSGAFFNSEESYTFARITRVRAYQHAFAALGMAQGLVPNGNFPGRCCAFLPHRRARRKRSVDRLR